MKIQEIAKPRNPEAAERAKYRREHREEIRSEQERILDSMKET